MYSHEWESDKQEKEDNVNFRFRNYNLKFFVKRILACVSIIYQTDYLSRFTKKSQIVWETDYEFRFVKFWNGFCNPFQNKKLQFFLKRITESVSELYEMAFVIRFPYIMIFLLAPPFITKLHPTSLFLNLTFCDSLWKTYCKQ